MSTTERKARKRAGIRFEKPAKVGTPMTLRRHYVDAQLAKVQVLLKQGLISTREHDRAGRAIDKGKDWTRAVPRIARNARRAQKGGK